MRQLVYALFGGNNLVPIDLWQKKIVVKCKKVYKYFVRDYSFTGFKLAYFHKVYQNDNSRKLKGFSIFFSSDSIYGNIMARWNPFCFV